MKYFTKLIKSLMAILFAVFLLITACEDEGPEVILYGSGEINGIASSSSILAGESITFTDLSTKVYFREWNFVGGDPGISSDSVVTVTYSKGGSYIALLNVIYVDNQTDVLEFPVEVEGSTDPPATGFGIYSENEGLGEFEAPLLQENNAYTISVVTSAFEGTEALYFAFLDIDSWGAMASIKPAGDALADLSDYANGTYNISIRSTCSKIMLLRLQSSNGEKAIITLDPTLEPYGFERDGGWHTLAIPMTDFTDNNSSLDLTKISDYLVLRSGEDDVKIGEDWDFYIDHFYISN